MRLQYSVFRVCMLKTGCLNSGFLSLLHNEIGLGLCNGLSCTGINSLDANKQTLPYFGERCIMHKHILDAAD